MISQNCKQPVETANSDRSINKETAQGELWRNGLWRDGVSNALCSILVIVAAVLIIILIKRYVIDECVEKKKGNEILHNLASNYESMGIQYH